MKKVLSMLLCLMLLALALTSCGDKTTTNPEADRPNLTLRMAIVVDDKTTDEGVAAMQKAFNDQCEVLLATHIEFECIKASEYKARMTEIMNEVKAAKNNPTVNTEDAMAGVGEDVTNDANTYPAASKGQFDIVMIADKAMYDEFVANGWLKGLNTHLTGTFKPLNTKILASAKELTLVNGECYGIPANEAYGTYKYVMVNKAAADFYNIETSEIRSLTDAYQLITLMEAASAENGLSKWKTLYGENFSVIRETEEGFALPNVQYLTQDLKTPGLFGITYNRADSFTQLGNAKNLLKDDTYKRYLTMKFGAAKAGYFSEDGTAENFLIGLTEGEYELRFSNENYYFLPIAFPTLNADEVFSGMLSVSSFTVNEKRSVEIIQELMTNATKADLLNIALFGDAKTNYTMENDCVVYRNMSNYGAHPDYLFGNLREFALPCAAFGQTADTYSYVASQNANLVTPLFDADFADSFKKVDAEKWAAFDAYCKTKYDELMASGDMAAFEAKLAALVTEMNASEYFTPNQNGYSFALEGANLNLWDDTYLGGAFWKYIALKKGILQ